MMNVEMIRKLYEYHFAANRRLWDDCVMALSDELFNQKNAYSEGGVGEQVVHIMKWDEQWLSRLKEIDPPPRLEFDHFDDREAIERYLDYIERQMREYLANLTDEQFAGTVTVQSQTWGEMTIPVWQILLHVVNHATDHRAQTLRLLDQLGAPTFEQDFMLYLYAWDN